MAETKRGILSYGHDRKPIISSKRVLRTALALGVTAAALGGVQTLQPGSNGKLASPAIAEAYETGPTQVPASKPPAKHCSTFRIRAKDIMAGYGCDEDGARATKVPGYPVEKGWEYSFISINGISKCFYVNKGRLSKHEVAPTADQIGTCQTYWPILVGYRFMRKFNCGFLPSGLQGCDGPTGPVPISDNCTNTSVYRNSATDEPSPWNVEGKGNGGFSDRIPRQTLRTYTSYRSEIATSDGEGQATSEDGGAIVVRELGAITGKWGLMRDGCVDEKYRHGGSSTVPGIHLVSTR